MEAQLEELRTAALAEIAAAADVAALDALRAQYLGKTGSLAGMGEGMRTLSKEDKPRLGKLLNDTRTAVASALDERQAALAAQADLAAFAQVDVTRPGTAPFAGSLHPVTQVEERAVQILRRMGFALTEAPTIEDAWHNFDALNMPAGHFARNEHETFSLADGRFLRTQMSPMQIRAMVAQPPPLRVMAVGTCLRRMGGDETHLTQFTQLEGLNVDHAICLADLKGTMELFLHELAGPKVEYRWRPHYFPFAEPSFELDVLTSGDRWIEMAGCGMVVPAVFEAISARREDGAYDPEAVSGFAFGFGLDRLAMYLAGSSDLRQLDGKA